MDKRIGAQLYTIAKFCQTIEDFEESCRKVSEIGYKVVQLSGIGDFSGEEIKRILDKYGLICACTHRHPNKYLEHLDEEIQFHKTIGCKVCGMRNGKLLRVMSDSQKSMTERHTMLLFSRRFAHVQKCSKDLRTR